MIQEFSAQYELKTRPKMMLQSFGFFEEPGEELDASPVIKPKGLEQVKEAVQEKYALAKGVVLKFLRREV